MTTEIFPLTIRCAVKSTRTNADTGERTITLSVPKSEAGRVAQLSIYDDIIFTVTFTPDDISNQPQI
jgi:hypothetical protein